MEYHGRKIRVNNIDMNVVIAGEGQDVLLVHGFPDTHKVAACAAGCGTVAAALAIALLRHAPKPAASAVAREVRA